MSGRSARVLVAGELAGRLEELGDGRTRFKYAPQWLQRPKAVPISMTMALRAEPYDAPGLHPFFANLLPEGWLLELSFRKLKIPKEDEFGLLLALGSDCVGAIEIEPEGAK